MGSAGSIRRKIASNSLSKRLACHARHPSHAPLPPFRYVQGVPHRRVALHADVFDVQLGGFLGAKADLIARHIRFAQHDTPRHLDRGQTRYSHWHGRTTLDPCDKSLRYGGATSRRRSRGRCGRRSPSSPGSAENQAFVGNPIPAQLQWVRPLWHPARIPSGSGPLAYLLSPLATRVGRLCSNHRTGVVP